MKNKMWVPQIISVVMLLFAFNEDNPYSYYTILRFVVCGVSGYIAFKFWEVEDTALVWIFGATTVLYNPLFKIHLDRNTWEIINALTIILLVFSVYKLKQRNDVPDRPKQMQNGLLKAKKEYATLTPSIKKIVDHGTDELVSVIQNNIKWLPENVLSMDYTIQAISAFIFHYTVRVIRPKLPDDPTSFIIMFLTLEKIFNGDLEKIAKFNPTNIIHNEEFSLMPNIIAMHISFPIENRTALLIFIEKHMEKITGKRTRYMH